MNENTTFIIKAIWNLLQFCNKSFDKSLWPNGPTGEQYIEGLIRDKGRGKNRGSYIPGLNNIHKTEEFLQTQDWEEVTPKHSREGCRYFQVKLPENDRGYGPAYVGVLTLGQCRQNGWDVFLDKDDEHGQRLITRNKDLLDTNVITLIVEGDMMSTWHPGDPMPETPQPIPLPSTEWDDEWPVYMV